MPPQRSPFPARIVADDLVIRLWTLDDREALTTLVTQNLDHLRPWMAWAHDEPISDRRRTELIERWARYWASGAGAVYAIEVADHLVGGCALHRKSGVIDIGYWLASDASGHGFATRTTTALVDASLARDDVDVVQISHDASNDRSAAVPQRLGFADVTTPVGSPVRTWQLRRP